MHLQTSLLLKDFYKSLSSTQLIIYMYMFVCLCTGQNEISLSLVIKSIFVRALSIYSY